MKPGSTLAQCPERTAWSWYLGLEPRRRVLACPPKLPAHYWLQAFSEPRGCPENSGLPQPEASLTADFAAQASRWDLARVVSVPSPPGAREAPLSCPEPAMHWPSAAPHS